jgi:hypothetical protein
MSRGTKKGAASGHFSAWRARRAQARSSDLYVAHTVLDIGAGFSLMAHAVRDIGARLSLMAHAVHEQ